MRLRRRPEELSEQEQLLLDAALFDHEWYGGRAGLSLERLEAVRHYLEHGVAAGASPHPLFDPSFVRRRLGPKRSARLGDGDPLTFVLRRGLDLPTHPLLVPGAEGLIEADVETWLREQHAAGPGSAAPPLDKAAVSVVIRCEAAPERTLVAARAAAETASADDLLAEVLVLDATGSRDDGVVLGALRGLPGVRVVPDADSAGVAAAAPVGEVVVLLHDHSKPRPGWLPALLAALETPSVLAAAPLLIGASGAIESAGAAFPATGGLPHPLLRDFPVEDAAAVGAVRFAALTGGALAVRREDLLAVGEPDLALGGLAEVDFCRRLAAYRPGRFRVVTEAHVRHPANHPDDRSDATARERFLAAWPAEAGDDVRLWSACGFRVLDRELRREGDLERRLCMPQPVLLREGRLQVSETPRPLRWAIKNPAPAGPVAEEWGDTHFARDLADALRALGHEVVIDHREAFERPTARHDDVALLLRGPIPLDPTPEQISMAWVISHPDQITAREVASYDVVFAASRTWSVQRSTEWGLAIEPLLQATNPARFSPEGATADSGPSLLFVGNSRKTYRTIVRDAIESGLPLTVYGADWEPFLPEGVVAAEYLDNARLGSAYRAAGIVLNDHWDDMREHGFLSNRLFDAVASAARVVTDDVAGLEGVFGPSVQPYRDRTELVRLCTLQDPDEVFGSESARIAAATKVAREHSFAARARVLDERAYEARRRRGFV